MEKTTIRRKDIIPLDFNRWSPPQFATLGSGIRLRRENRYTSYRGVLLESWGSRSHNRSNEDRAFRSSLQSDNVKTSTVRDRSLVHTNIFILQFSFISIQVLLCLPISIFKELDTTLIDNVINLREVSFRSPSRCLLYQLYYFFFPAIRANIALSSISERKVC